MILALLLRERLLSPPGLIEVCAFLIQRRHQPRYPLRHCRGKGYDSRRRHLGGHPVPLPRATPALRLLASMALAPRLSQYKTHARIDKPLLFPTASQTLTYGKHPAQSLALSLALYLLHVIRLFYSLLVEFCFTRTRSNNYLSRARSCALCCRPMKHAKLLTAHLASIAASMRVLAFLPSCEVCTWPQRPQVCSWIVSADSVTDG